MNPFSHASLDQGEECFAGHAAQRRDVRQIRQQNQFASQRLTIPSALEPEAPASIAEFVVHPNVAFHPPAPQNSLTCKCVFTTPYPLPQPLEDGLAHIALARDRAGKPHFDCIGKGSELGLVGGADCNGRLPFGLEPQHCTPPLSQSLGTLAMAADIHRRGHDDRLVVFGLCFCI